MICPWNAQWEGERENQVTSHHPLTAAWKTPSGSPRVRGCHPARSSRQTASDADTLGPVADSAATGTLWPRPPGTCETPQTAWRAAESWAVRAERERERDMELWGGREGEREGGSLGLTSPGSQRSPSVAPLHWKNCSQGQLQKVPPGESTVAARLSWIP